MTWESEEAYNRCEGYNDTLEDTSIENYDEIEKFKTFLGEEIEVEGAPEPSDIIWENRGISTTTKTIRTAIVVVITLILLAISFVMIFSSQRYA